MDNQKKIKPALEKTIDNLVSNFIHEPYVHRSEASLCSDLFTILSMWAPLQQTYPLGPDGKYNTALVHTAWPAFSSGFKKRTGTYDLVILDPADVAKATRQEFSAGRIRPAFAVQIRLNASLSDLAKTDTLLRASDCGAAYMVHLWQPHKRATARDVKDLQGWLTKAGKTVAVAVFGEEDVLVKELGKGSLVAGKRA